jgi:hypothetical protein
MRTRLNVTFIRTFPVLLHTGLLSTVAASRSFALLSAGSGEEGLPIFRRGACSQEKPKGGYTLITLPRAVTPYRDSVDGTRDHVTYQKLVMQ